MIFSRPPRRLASLPSSISRSLARELRVALNFCVEGSFEDKVKAAAAAAAAELLRQSD